MHVAPFAHLFSTIKIIVGHVHSPGERHGPVDDHNLPVVAREDMVHPREAYGVELVYLHSRLAQGDEVFLLQRTVVGVVAKAVKQRPHLHALFHL